MSEISEYSELWMPVAEFEGVLEVSNFGRVRTITRTVKTNQWTSSIKAGRLLPPKITNKGYVRVSFKLEGKLYHRAVHSLVLEAFIGERPEQFEADHIDYDITNNKLENLRWLHHIDNKRRRRSQVLDVDKALKIKNLRLAGVPLLEIAKHMGTNVSNIKNVVYGNCWTDITTELTEEGVF